MGKWEGEIPGSFRVPYLHEDAVKTRLCSLRLWVLLNLPILSDLFHLQNKSNSVPNNPISIPTTWRPSWVVRQTLKTVDDTARLVLTLRHTRGPYQSTMYSRSPGRPSSFPCGQTSEIADRDYEKWHVCLHQKDTKVTYMDQGGRRGRKGLLPSQGNEHGEVWPSGLANNLGGRYETKPCGPFFHEGLKIPRQP